MRRRDGFPAVQLEGEITFENLVLFRLFMTQLHITHLLRAWRHVGAVPHFKSDRRLQELVRFRVRATLGFPFPRTYLEHDPLFVLAERLAKCAINQSREPMRVEWAVGSRSASKRPKIGFRHKDGPSHTTTPVRTVPVSGRFVDD